MRKFLRPLTLGIVVTILFFQLPTTIFAHAGVQKKGDNIIVTFYQSPISPLVGEEIKLTFVVTDQNLTPKINTEGALILIDTFYGDESKDKVILTKQFTTDANGAVEFTYTFDKENYFNIELQFKGQEEKWQHIDYLIQPRQTGKIITKTQDLRVFQLLFAVGTGAVLSIIAGKILRSRVRSKWT